MAAIEAGVVATVKRCSSCQTERELTEFARGQGTCRLCRRKYSVNNYNKGKRCKECDAPVVNHSSNFICRACWRKRPRTALPRRYVTFHGYVKLTAQWGHPNADHRGELSEHVLEMSGILQRGLLRGENVHHLNGVRDDNRPENLELWVTSQPSGQRPADLVAWAREILDRYSHEL